MSHPQDNLPVLGDLLAELRTRGFSIGVDHYLRVQMILERAGTDANPSELARLLAPLLVCNSEEQAQFYEIFPRYAALLGTPDAETGRTKPAIITPLLPRPTAKPTPAAGLDFKQWYYALAGFVGLALLISLAVWLFGPPKKNDNLNGNSNINTFPPDVTFPPPATFPVPVPTPTPQFARRPHRGFYAAALLVPLALLLLYEWYRRRRRRLALEAFRTLKPPHVWNLRVPERELEIYETVPFYDAARTLRRRQEEEQQRFDLRASLAATIAAAGFPTLRHRTTNRVPEYLLLIERLAPRDHLARCYVALAEALEHEGLFASHYFFDGDPRVCVAPDGTHIPLVDLQNRYSNHRLALFSDGNKLLDPITGQAASWTELLHYWPQRALLTAEDTTSWGRREAVLAESFVVLPADLSGLGELVERLESQQTTEINPSGSVTTWPANPREQVAQLHNTLPADVFQWLCACAAYPELHWNLTLQLSALAGTPDELLTERNLLSLSRLPWFREGRIPDAARWELLSHLVPERERAIRQYIISLLEQNPPPDGSFAADNHQLQLAFQRWRTEKTPARLRRLVEMVRRLPRRAAFRDAVIVRWVKEAWRSPLALLLPRKLHDWLYQYGIRAFGLTTTALSCAALLVASVSWFSVGRLAPRNVEVEIAAASPTPFVFPQPTPELYPYPTPGPYDAPPLPEVIATPYVPNVPALPNPGTVRLPPVSIKPGPVLPRTSPGAGPVLPTPLPLPGGSPLPGAPATPTPATTPTSLVPGLTLAASRNTVCLNALTPATVQLQANATGFAETPAFVFAANGGKLSPAGNSATWDLSQEKPNTFTVNVTAAAGAARQTATVQVRMALCPCAPVLRVSCQGGVATVNPATFTAILDGVDPNLGLQPIFTWSVPDGKVVDGQGTPSLRLDLAGLEGQTLPVTVEVSNLPPLCVASAPLVNSCTAKVNQTLTAFVDEFAVLTAEEEKARLDNFAAQVRKLPSAQAVIIFYEGVDDKGQRVDTAQLTRRLTDYLVKTRGLNPKQIAQRQGSNPTDKFKVQLYAVPPGAAAP